MRVLIDFYDQDSSNNLLPILSMKPDKVLFFYDESDTPKLNIDRIFKACSKHLPNLIFEIYTVDSTNVNKVVQRFKEIIPFHRNQLTQILSENPSTDLTYMIDLSGGQGLMQVAGYQIGIEYNIPMLYADIRKNIICDIKDGTIVGDISHISVEDYLTAQGACIIGTSHIQPNEEDYQKLLRLSKYIFKDIRVWSTTCRYMQITMAGQKELTLRNKEAIRFNQKMISPDKKLLELCEKLGFIKHFVYDKEVQFQFTSPMTKQYLTNYGIWLELFVYMEAKKLQDVKDVTIGAMIDWDDKDGIEIVGNEIDVLLSKRSRPIFISCKLTDIDTATINEIVINTKRAGGINGKGILVTFSKIKSTNSWTLKRAKEMGVKILDKDDILSGRFVDILEETIDGLLE